MSLARWSARPASLVLVPHASCVARALVVL
jgi:hypothetical protein